MVQDSKLTVVIKIEMFQDEDGVLTFPELNVVMKSLGQRPTGKIQKKANCFKCNKWTNVYL
jgi:hypothetical protein